MGIESFLVYHFANRARKVPRGDAIERDLGDSMLTGDRLTSRLVIDIAGKTDEIGMTLLLPLYSEVIDVREVDHAPDQDDR